MRALILGLGYLGLRAAELLMERGSEVHAVRRSAAFPSGVHGYQRDLLAPSSLQDLPEVEHLLLCFPPSLTSGSGQDGAEYLELVRKCLKELRFQRVLLVSSTSVFGEASGLLSERTLCAPKDAKGQALQRAEDEVLADSRSSAVVRASGIYGPSRTRLLGQLLRGELDPSERSILTNRIHRDDLARIVLWALTESTERGLWLASDTEPSFLGAMQDWATALHLPPAFVAEHFPPSPKARVGEGRKSRQIVAQRLKEEGFVYSFPSFREGYAAILREMGAPLRED